jgi:hypothetical protein
MRNTVAPRRARATDLLHPEVKARLAAPGEAELPRERQSHPRNAAYDGANFAARVISPFRHALKSVMFLKRVPRGRYRFLPAAAPTFFFVLKGAFGAGTAFLGSSFFSAGSVGAACGAFGSKLCIENLFESTLIVLAL